RTHPRPVRGAWRGLRPGRRSHGDGNSGVRGQEIRGKGALGKHPSRLRFRERTAEEPCSGRLRTGRRAEHLLHRGTPRRWSASPVRYQPHFISAPRSCRAPEAPTGLVAPEAGAPSETISPSRSSVLADVQTDSYAAPALS